MSILNDFPELTFKDITPVYNNVQLSAARNIGGGYFIEGRFPFAPFNSPNGYIVRKMNVSSNVELGRFIDDPIRFRFFGENQKSPILMNSYQISKEGDFPCFASLFSGSNINFNNLEILVEPNGTLIDPPDLITDVQIIKINVVFEMYEIGVKEWVSKEMLAGTKKFEKRGPRVLC